MQVEVKIDENCKNPKIIIVADKMTDEIGAFVQSLSASYPKVIAGFSGDEVRLLEESEFVCIYAENQKVYAETANREYILRPRLYELEAGLNKRLFVRISMNEWYAKDISKKRRIVNKLKGNSGLPLSPPPYGYRKDPEAAPTRWIVDEAAAVNVRRIFRMALEGFGIGEIAPALEADGILTPTAYWQSKGIGRDGKKTRFSPTDWRHSTVAKILALQEYCGDVINFKTFSKSCKMEKQIDNPEENRAVFLNVHEPVIDLETWEKV